MDLKSRLRKVERDYLLNEHLFPVMPDYDNWTEEDLNKGLTEFMEEFNKEQAIKSYKDAERYYNYHCEEGNITEEEKKLDLKNCKNYWDGEYK